MKDKLGFNFIFLILLITSLFFLLISETRAENIRTGDEEYLLVVDVMPTPVGGLENIMKKMTYPSAAKRTGVEGKVYVLVYINENGDVDDAKLIKGVGAGCDEEAISGIKKSKFNPGKNKGVAVKSKLSMAITFKIS